jgi:DNA repair exonuclease SbcCD ATPase subunit
MILFEKVRWKNFLSTGNQETEIVFTEKATNIVIGTNGAGKSTVLDALCFSLFGKPFRKINKPQLVNSVNEKDCRVEVEFSIGNTEWKIIRGIKPNVFEIYRDGNPLNQSAAALDQQKWLEQNVLKMNYKSFTQIVILGSSTFVPFMQLTAANRREVIEDLLDIRIFSSMNTIIKDKIRTLKEDVKVLELKKESLGDKVQMQENFIEELENRGKKNIEDKESKIGELLVEENTWMGDNEEKNKELIDLQGKLEDYTGATEKLRTLGNLKGKISNKVSTITKEHKFFTQNTVCPTCDQAIEETFRINRINDAQTKAKNK